MSSAPDDGERPGYIRRFVDFVAHDQLRGRRLVLALAGLIGMVAIIGLADFSTGSRLTIGAFYLVPVVICASVAGPRPALVLAGVSAVVWVVADRSIDPNDRGLAVNTANAGLRFAIFAVVVVLLAAIRDALPHAARSSDRRSREFLAFAAHQLRTPTASVNATAQALLARGGTPAQEAALVRLAAEANRVGRLVSSILRFVRLDQGDPMPRRVVDIGSLCLEEAERHTDLALPITVDVEIEPGVALVTRASPEAIQEALGNLIDNGRRHARSRVVVSTRVNGRTGEVVVVDDGPGLPPGSDETAFAPFISLDGRGGSGLGLSIARRLVESQGGSLRYDTGAFILSLPITR